MLAHAHTTKAAKPREAQLRARQQQVMREAWDAYLLIATRSPGIVEAFARGDLDRIMRGIDTAAGMFAAAWLRSFVDVGNLTASHLSRKLPIKKARPTVRIAFDQVDPLAVEAMRRNKLRLISSITQQQRSLVRPILVRGIDQGLGPRAMARELRNVIGLTDTQGEQLDSYRRKLEQGRAAGMRDMLDGNEPAADVLDQSSIDRMVSGKAAEMIEARALVISRTEATIVTSLAQREGLRQGLEATGISRQLVGHVWNCTHDHRTREWHDQADGQRRLIDEPFDIGGESIMAPGLGSAKNSSNCRCVEGIEFFDGDAERDAWREGSPS